MRLIKFSMAAVAAAALAGSPVLAQTGAASSLSVADRAGADMTEASELRGGWFVPLIAIIAIILGIVAATGGDGDRPHSP